MAELIGHMIANWPTFLIGLAVVIIAIIGTAWLWIFSSGGLDPIALKEKRRYLGEKNHGKK